MLNTITNIELIPAELQNTLFILHLKQSLDQLQGCKFVSLEYTTKKTGEKARYNIQVGVKYSTLLENALTEMEIEEPLLRGIDRIACAELMQSFKDSLAGNNEGYTKKGLYAHFTPNLKININDRSFELDGVVNSKVVLEKGVYTKVNSADLTIAKNKLKKLTRLGNYRSFALDIGNIKVCKLNGEVLQLCDE